LELALSLQFVDKSHVVASAAIGAAETATATRIKRALRRVERFECFTICFMVDSPFV